jgi:hypothetical protein
LISQVFLFRKCVRLTTGCRLYGSLNSTPPLPYGVTDSRRMRYSNAITTHSLLMSANIIYNHVSTGRGKNLIESIGSILRYERFFNILILAHKGTSSYISSISSGRMTISVASCVLVLDYFDFVEIAQ